MDLMLLLRAIAALGLVIGLIALAAVMARRMGWGNGGGAWRGERRLSVSESLSIDAKRRILLIKCDDQEHLVLLGLQNEIVLKPSGFAAAVSGAVAGMEMRATAKADPAPAEAPAPSSYDDFRAADPPVKIKPPKPKTRLVGAPVPAVAAKSERRVIRREPTLDLAPPRKKGDPSP